MATDLATINSEKLSVGWKSPQFSIASNRKTGAVNARGVVRGFTPTVEGGNIVTLSVDPLSQDSAMVLRQASADDPYGLTYRESSDVSLVFPEGLTGTVYVGVEHIFASDTSTSAKWKVYTQAEYDDGTTNSAILAFCYNVTDGYIGYWCRDDQWKWKSHDETGWLPLIEHDFNDNDGWELSSTAVGSTPTTSETAWLGFSTGAGVAQSNALQVDYNDCYTGYVKQRGGFYVNAGEQLSASFWIKRSALLTECRLTDTAGVYNSFRFLVRFYSETATLSSIGYFHYRANDEYDIADLADSEWILMTGDIVVHSGASRNTQAPATARSARIELLFDRQDDTVDSTYGTITIDGIQIYAKPYGGNEPGWRDGVSRYRAATKRTNRIHIESRDSGYSDFVLHQHTDGKLYLSRPNGGATALVNMFQIGTESIEIDLTHYGSFASYGDVTLEGDMQLTGAMTVTDGVDTATIDAGVVSLEGVEYNSAQTFYKSMHCDGWLGIAASNSSSLLASATDSGSPYVTLPLAGTATFYIPITVPPCSIETVRFFWKMGLLEDYPVTARLIKRNVGTYVDSFVSAEFSTHIGEELGEGSSFDVNHEITSESGYEYYWKIVVADDGSQDAGISALIMTYDVVEIAGTMM